MCRKKVLLQRQASQAAEDFLKSLSVFITRLQTNTQTNSQERNGPPMKFMVAGNGFRLATALSRWITYSPSSDAVHS